MKKRYNVEYFDKSGPQATQKKLTKIHASSTSEARQIAESRGCNVYQIYL